MFGALKHGFRSLATVKLVVNVVGKLKTEKNRIARGLLATARLSCFLLLPLLRTIKGNNARMIINGRIIFH